ncbi:MAG: methylenetetrahydrofolate reductase [Candidatus Omnitrophota bacterium]|nr:methylenetetrahydrofolate reductase [Candidatus Omnitrophota bacterium]
MTFSEKVKAKKFIVTSEIGPPKGVDVESFLDDAVLVKGRVDAINVTDLQSSMMRLGSLAFSRLLIERGIEPIFQMTCRDRNRLALQSDLLSAYVLGVRNVLILTGDHPALGDHPEAKPVYDLDSVGLLRAARLLEKGQDMVGKKLRGAPKFYLGAVVNPGVDPLEPELIKMEKKIEAGAEFFQTQAIFDIKSFEQFMKTIKDYDVPVFAGIVVLKSADMARFMNKHVPGIFIPENIISEIEKAQDKDAKSVEIAARLIKDLKGLAGGIHIMSIGMNKKVPLVLDAAGL